MHREDTHLGMRGNGGIIDTLRGVGAEEELDTGGTTTPPAGSCTLKRSPAACQRLAGVSVAAGGREGATRMGLAAAGDVGDSNGRGGAPGEAAGQALLVGTTAGAVATATWGQWVVAPAMLGTYACEFSANPRSRPTNAQPWLHAPLPL